MYGIKRNPYESFPFGLDTLALKVGGRMYALLALNDDPLTLSLKCDPWRAEELRREHPGIAPTTSASVTGTP